MNAIQKKGKIIIVHQFTIDILSITLVQADSIHPSRPGLLCVNQILEKGSYLLLVELLSLQNLIDLVFLCHAVCNSPSGSLCKMQAYFG